MTLVAAVVAAVLGVGVAPLAPPPTVGTDVPPPGWPQPPAASASAFLLADADTGQVLAARGADERRPVASTVKVLTAMTVMSRLAPDRRVTAGPEAGGFPPGAATAGLEPGEAWTVEDLLEALIARSANDAAAVLAAAVGGDERRFVEMMAADAAALGIDGAVLTSPDGLDDGNRLSARDLATISRAALGEPAFAAIAARPVVEIGDLGRVRTRNELLFTYPGADGVKTGFTNAAGRCLVASATRDGRRLLAVVLGSRGPTGHFTDAARLLDWGFSTFVAGDVSGPGPELRVRLPGRWLDFDAPPVRLLVPGEGPPADVVAFVPVEPRAGAPTLTALWGGGELGRVPLAAAGPAPPPPRAGAAAVGSWLMDRAYAAMRATTAAETWPGGLG